jgi:hypothetical protein
MRIILNNKDQKGLFYEGEAVCAANLSIPIVVDREHHILTKPGRR